MTKSIQILASMHVRGDSIWRCPERNQSTRIPLPLPATSARATCFCSEHRHFVGRSLPLRLSKGAEQKDEKEQMRAGLHRTTVAVALTRRVVRSLAAMRICGILRSFVAASVARGCDGLGWVGIGSSSRPIEPEWLKPCCLNISAVLAHHHPSGLLGRLRRSSIRAFLTFSTHSQLTPYDLCDLHCRARYGRRPLTATFSP